MLMPNRKYNAGSGYRYGFNGKEQDKETSSTTTYDYGFRIYSPALGRFLSVDPLTKTYPWYTPYQFAGNKPIGCIDLDGLEEKWKIGGQASMEYRPVIKTPDAGTAINNASHNTIAFVWNCTLGGLCDGASGLWNGGVDLASGKYNNVTATDQFVNGLNNLNDYYDHTSPKQKLNNFVNTATDLKSWELPVQLLVAHKLSSPKVPITASSKEIVGARVKLATKVYEEQGFSPAKALSHMEGVNFEKGVQTASLKKGDVIQQWVGENGVGDYFTTLENGAAQNLGVPGGYSNRTLKQFTLTKDVEVLKSTAADYKGNAGGGTQYFSAELKNNITPKE
jgi:RHS repeat-associated protein